MFATVHSHEGVVLLERTPIGKTKPSKAEPDEAPPRASPFYRAGGKRLLDVALGVLALLLSLPLIAALALLVRVQRKGRIIEKVEAYAPDGRQIRFARFNTSHPDDVGRKVDHYWRRDTERTPVNDFLIRSGLDRLPALIAVVRGDLALVGPDVQSFRREDSKVTPVRPDRSVRPGLTGLGRLTGQSYGLGFSENLDDFYARHESLRLDLRIMLKSLRLTAAATF